MSIGGSRGGDRRTRKGAFAIMDALLQVPIDWSKPYDQIGNDVAANKTCHHARPEHGARRLIRARRARRRGALRPKPQGF